MSVTVNGHQHDPAVVFEGAGHQRLLIQTGTLLLEFHGAHTDEDWVRDRLTHPVLELQGDLLLARILATASAAPCSMTYLPPDSLRVMSFGGKLVPVIDANNRPVVDTEFTPGSVRLPLLGAGWAVDRTLATRTNNTIQLAIDLATFGSCQLARLAYSVLVTIIPPTLAELAVLEGVLAPRKGDHTDEHYSAAPSA